VGKVSKLEELIAKYCPDGVEYAKLGEICEIRSGWGFPNIEQGKSMGKYPFYKVGDMNSVGNEIIMTGANNYVDEETITRLRCRPAPRGTVIFPKIGAAIRTNKKRILSQKACYDNNIIGLIPSDAIISRYLFYQMETINLMTFADYSGAMPSIRKTTLENFLIPLPPLPVQREIVRILDNFTELTKELTKELTARKKQYEYYRDKLLTFGDEVEWKTLGKVVTIKNGKDYKHFGEGNIPVYGSGGIIAYIDKFAYNRPSVLIPRKGSIDKLYYVETPFWTVDTIFYTDINTEIINPKFVYYYLQTQHLERLNTAGGVPSLTQTVLKSVPIPVPPLEEQERIVAILDRFDTLCNDLTSGLPAEIEARRKQYEYYRDKLLSFPKRSADKKVTA
jgi:type I restriction enzyme, S subunit